MYLLRTNEVKKHCLAHIESLLACDPPQHVVEVKKYRKDKTASQRAYFHTILDLVCDYTGDDPEEAKLRIKYAVLPLKKITVNGSDHLYPISSENTTTQQYSELIEAALIFANEAGVAIPPPSHWGME